MRGNLASAYHSAGRMPSGWPGVLVPGSVGNGGMSSSFGSDEPYEVHDLLSDTRYTWRGERNYVRLDPAAMPAHLFVVRPGQASGA